MNQETIAGIASGMGGGIGIIRISGENAFLIAGKIFRKKKYVENRDEKWDDNYFEQQESHTVKYGYIVDKDKIIDEVMVLVMKAPKTYTCEDVIEIDSHGGAYVVQKILKLVLKNGARLAEPGEFTKRAFLNGRIDLSQAEAVMKMISSKSDFALENAVKQLEGRISKYIEEIRQEILYDMSFIESALDDPEHYDLDGYAEILQEKLEKQKSELKHLLENFENGRMKSEGINTVIIGKPNAGKSSLMNLLLDEERAIVTNIAGTTRDILEETVQIGSVILNLTDTAGIHETEDIIESMGVEKATECLEKADFIIYVIDVHDIPNESDETIIGLLQNKRGVILLNKTDKEFVFDIEALQQKLPWKCIPFSSRKGTGLDALEKYITDSYLEGRIEYNDQIYLTSIRHREAVEKAVQSMEQVINTIQDGMPEDFYMVDLMDAYKNLGLINGETASEDLVNKIFQEFCMGK